MALRSALAAAAVSRPVRTTIAAFWGESRDCSKFMYNWDSDSDRSPPLRTSPATPTTVVHGPVPFGLNVKRLPTASSFGHKWRAMVSFTIADIGRPAESDRSNQRPRTSGIPIVRKYCALTDE